MPIPVELISMFGGAVSGALFKAWGIAQQNKKEMFEMVMKKGEQQNNFYNAAAERTKTNYGKATRRFIVICVLSLFMALMIMPFFDINTVVEVAGREKSILWGLIEWTSKTKFESVSGYFFSQDARTALSAILGFYLGSSSQNVK